MPRQVSHEEIAEKVAARSKEIMQELDGLEAILTSLEEALADELKEE